MTGQTINWWDSDVKKVRTNSMQGAQQSAMNQQQAQQQQAPGAAGGVQSTPVIQPFVVVPYSTPMQPIFHYNDGTLPIGDIDSNYIQAHGMPQNPMMGQPGQMNPMMGQPGQMNPMMGMNNGFDGIYYNMDEEEEIRENKKNKKRRARKKGTVSAASIIIMILVALFGTVTLFIEPLLTLIGVEMETAIVSWNAGSISLFSSFEYIIEAITRKVEFDFQNTLFLVRGLLVIGSVLLGIGFLVALFTIGRKGTPIFGKIITFLAFVAVAVAVVLCLLGEGYTVGITAWILAGLAFLVFFVSLFGRRKSKKRNRGI